MGTSHQILLASHQYSVTINVPKVLVPHYLLVDLKIIAIITFSLAMPPFITLPTPLPHNAQYFLFFSILPA